MKPLTAHRRGYTLIEILVVVVIMGIAAAVVVPSMLHAGSLTIQAAARMVVTDVLMAQNEAVATRQPRRVVFNIDGNSYSLTDQNGVTLSAPTKTGTYVVDFDTDPRFAGVRFDVANFGGQPLLVFDEMGAPGSGGSVELSADGNRYRVIVTPFTGRVTVEPVNGG